MTKRRDYSIPPHVHCQVCGRAIPEGKMFCSAKCEETYVKRESRYRRVTRIYYIALIIIIVTLVALMMLRA